MLIFIPAFRFIFYFGSIIVRLAALSDGLITSFNQISTPRFSCHYANTCSWAINTPRCKAYCMLPHYATYVTYVTDVICYPWQAKTQTTNLLNLGARPSFGRQYAQQTANTATCIRPHGRHALNLSNHLRCTKLIDNSIL